MDNFVGISCREFAKNTKLIIVLIMIIIGCYVDVDKAIKPIFSFFKIVFI